MKIIFFDFDGVIADTFSACFDIINARETLSADEYRARFEGNINLAIRKTPADQPPFDFFAEYNPKLMTCQPNPDIVAAIKTLAGESTLIIVSSTISSSISKYLEFFQIKDYFKEILGNDIDKSKVKKINDILARYEVAPGNTVFITDTLGDIREATECQVKSIGITWGFHPRETLQKGNPASIIDSPTELVVAVQNLNLTTRRQSKE